MDLGGGNVAYLCTRGSRRQKCSAPGCRRVAVALCDAPSPRRGRRSTTCDAPCCGEHRRVVDATHDLCFMHARDPIAPSLPGIR